MTSFQTKEAYLETFESQINRQKSKENAPMLDAYLNAQMEQLTVLLEQLSKETFWQLIPRILGIDAKLCLLVEMVSFDEFSEEELIHMIEQDYSTYFKELCGYNLSKQTMHSLVFSVQ